MRSTYRRLGATEQAVWLRDRATPLHFALTAQIQGIFDADRLMNALHQLQPQHPLLRVKIALEPDGTPYFVEQAAPISCRVVLRQGETHWQQEVAWELSQPFDWTKSPLIRVVAVVEPVLEAAMVSELIVVCHHAIADGMSAVSLLHEILCLLGNSAPVGISSAVPSSLNSLDSLESLLPNYQPAPMLQKVLGVGALKLQQFWQRMHQKVNPASVLSAPLQVKAGYLSAAITAQLIRRCRQEETTVHAAICTAWLLAIAQRQGYAKPIWRCFSPINLRPYLAGQRPQTCGLYIAPAQSDQTITADTPFWQMARSLKADLIRQTAASHLLTLIQQHQLLISTRPRPEFVQRLFNQHCTSDVMVTNLGRLAIPQRYGKYGELVLNAVYGPAVRSGFEPERVCGVATLGDRLFYTVVCQDSDAESSLVNQATHILERAIADGAFPSPAPMPCCSKSSTVALQNVERSL